MSKLRVSCFTISLDGYGAGPSQDEQNPLGRNGIDLHRWLLPTRSFQSLHGRAGEGTTAGISAALRRLGFRLERFKTGTPPRLNGRTIDFAKTEIQPGRKMGHVTYLIPHR